MRPEDASPDPDLRRYLQILRRRKWVMALAVLVVVLTAVGVSYAQTSVYEGTAQLLITPTVNTSSVLNQSGVAATPTVQDVQTQMQIITSRPVEDIVKSQLGAAPTVTVSEIGQTTVVQIRASSTIPSQAALVANAYANAYLSSQREEAIDSLQAAGAQIQTKIDDLQTQIDGLDAEVAAAPTKQQATELANLGPQRDSLVSQQGLFKQQLAQLQLNASVATGGGQIVTPAIAATTPSSPRPFRNAVLSVVVGLLFGVAVCFVLDYLDDSVRTRLDVDRIAGGLPDLALIPRITGWKSTDRARTVSLVDPTSAAAEAYRTLRTSIQFVALDRPLRIIQVTSADAEEGKTTTLANLAVALANAGDRICMCCCDLRRPRIHEFFGLDNAIGFTSVILGTDSTSAAIQPVPGVERLSLLASGPLPPNPSELLASDRAAEVIQSLAAMFDVVLLDSPPVLPVTDAAIISGIADGTILVVNMGASTRREIGRTVQLLDQVHATLIGTVLNGVSEDTSDGYYRHSGYYTQPSEHQNPNDHLASIIR
jgi:polysaccharide biosynthesis transport protein